MLAELERRAEGILVYGHLAWKAQMCGDDRGSLAAIVCLFAIHEGVGERILSGAYLKSRPPGIKRPNIDDTAAHLYMLWLSNKTGEQQGESLAKAAGSALGKGKHASETAALKHRAMWWRQAKK